MSTPTAKELAWAKLIKQATAAGFAIKFNHAGVLVIIRDPEPPPAPQAP